MSAQLSYAINQGKAYAGMVFAQAPSDIISRSIEGGSVAFGVAVSRGTDKDNQAIIGGASGFLGLTIRSVEREGAINSGDLDYSVQETAGIIRDGYVYITCPAGCVPGNLVKFDNVTGILDTGAAGVGETQISGAYWDTTAVAGEVGVVHIVGTATVAGS